MTLAAFLFLLIAFLFTFNFSIAIECKFTFVEDDVPLSFDEVKDTDQNVIHINQLSNMEPFECEEAEVASDVQSRFNYDNFKPDDDDYEPAVVCETRNRTIYPKGLNNVRNEFRNVVNDKHYIQAISTEECVHKHKQCSEFLPSKCEQKYFKVYLKAFDEKTQKEYNENFYFPSSCACSAVSERIDSKKNATAEMP